MPTKTVDRKFQWRPGEGCDEEALARLQHAFPRPKTPMGEAWFMGDERRMFTHLMGDLGTVSVADLQESLGEIASGTHSFGPREEWAEWFHYFLSRLIPRCHDSYARHSLLESLVTAFMSQYPDRATKDPYPGFRSDVLNTLGRGMMDRACWSGGRVIIGKLLHRGVWPSGYWNWFDVSGDFSAAMFFCLKYLPPDHITPWMTSVLAIECPHWRAQVVVWLVGSHDVLSGAIRQPRDFRAISRPQIEWEWSHCLSGNRVGDETTSQFLPDRNRRELRDVVASVVTEDVLLDWMLSFADYDYLEAELAELPDRFRELYVVA